jgi:Domain of unknown function (DUF6265)
MTRVQIASFVAVACAALCSSKGQQAHDFALRPLSFLSGRWVNETPSEMEEETWSPASGESMIGSFRVVQHGRPIFYEFWAVELEDHRPVLKLKHFNAGLAGWEDKNSSTKLPLVSSDQNDAVFAETDGGVSLHYRRVAEKLTCTVHHVSNGKASDETFVLIKAPNESGQGKD